MNKIDDNEFSKKPKSKEVEFLLKEDKRYHPKHKVLLND
jgi:hypothetical protein